MSVPTFAHPASLPGSGAATSSPFPAARLDAHPPGLPVPHPREATFCLQWTWGSPALGPHALPRERGSSQAWLQPCPGRAGGGRDWHPVAAEVARPTHRHPSSPGAFGRKHVSSFQDINGDWLCQLPGRRTAAARCGRHMLARLAPASQGPSGTVSGTCSGARSPSRWPQAPCLAPRGAAPESGVDEAGSARWPWCRPSPPLRPRCLARPQRGAPHPAPGRGTRTPPGSPAPLPA